ncbi:response regulator, partial [Candidatus Pacearchaeota archaeon]|nr:response regulator [Candidatus Pacearchaeota archaeon]
LADDESSNRNLFEAILKSSFLNYEVQAFAEGASLVRRLEEDVSDIRLVVTDNFMPRVTGSEIIEKYARASKFKEIPFILCYGGDEEIGKKAVEDGAFGFIVKPMNLEEYVGVLRDALDLFKK